MLALQVAATHTACSHVASTTCNQHTVPKWRLWLKPGTAMSPSDLRQSLTESAIKQYVMYVR